MPPARRLRLALALEALEVLARDAPQDRLRVLDAGCGEGLLTIALARRNPHWSVLGVDLSAAALRTARAEAARHGLPNAAFATADLTADLGSSRYDAVVALECLLEIPDDHSALAAMSRALRPGGLFLGHVPERNWTPMLPGSEQTWRHEVRHGYTTAELAELARAAGLRVTEVKPTLRGTVGVAQELRDRVRRRRLAAQVLVYPLMLAAVPLERRGITWGPARALFLEAIRPPDALSSPPSGPARA
jgi:2-polyprenyl-3-methyl-5-hydroxy-6-metoxy-1,4-benzoquinol methylase